MARVLRGGLGGSPSPTTLLGVLAAWSDFGGALAAVGLGAVALVAVALVAGAFAAVRVAALAVRAFAAVPC